MSDVASLIEEAVFLVYGSGKRAVLRERKQRRDHFRATPTPIR
ncbi:hypothetical protein [Streptomyces sp. NPDC056632]